ncbi:hypothetical protein Zmor_019541 [Zophobas morio]|uniref:Uncharacterized protein n=1 Tax=Zophobas morio TaxID=2755281 RepID=A0AA38M9G3_9CUCU|nr:hypothetical protein Zmor_019541 [Zophobas morio]
MKNAKLSNQRYEKTRLPTCKQRTPLTFLPRQGRLIGRGRCRAGLVEHYLGGSGLSESDEVIRCIVDDVAGLLQKVAYGELEKDLAKIIWDLDASLAPTHILRTVKRYDVFICQRKKTFKYSSRMERRRRYQAGLAGSQDVAEGTNMKGGCDYGW